jgi:hypothetical protein
VADHWLTPCLYLTHFPLCLTPSPWLSVEGLEYPLDARELEKEPNITTPDANRIGVQVKHLSSKSVFDQHQEGIVQSLAAVAPQVDLS